MAKEDKKKNNDKKDSQKQSFFKGLRAELKRVSWPTFKQVVNNTIAVITIVLVVAVVVFVLDFIFEKLNTYGVGSLKALVTSSSSEDENVDATNLENAVTTEETVAPESTETTENVDATQAGTLEEGQTQVETTSQEGATTEAPAEGQFVDAAAGNN